MHVNPAKDVSDGQNGHAAETHHANRQGKGEKSRNPQDVQNGRRKKEKMDLQHKGPKRTRAGRENAQTPKRSDHKERNKNAQKETKETQAETANK